MDAYRETSAHSHCFPGTWEGLVKNLGSTFKGRVLPSEDFHALELLEALAKKSGEVRVRDTSRITDMIMALGRGIRKTPTMIFEGRKYKGIKEIRSCVEIWKKKTH